MTPTPPPSRFVYQSQQGTFRARKTAWGLKLWLGCKP